MADEDSVLKLECAADLDHVIGISVEARITLARISRGVRLPVTEIVEQHDAKVRLEVARYRLPHRLVAAEPVGKHHGALARAGEVHIVAADD